MKSFLNTRTVPPWYAVGTLGSPDTSPIAQLTRDRQIQTLGEHPASLAIAKQIGRFPGAFTSGTTPEPIASTSFSSFEPGEPKYSTYPPESTMRNGMSQWDDFTVTASDRANIPQIAPDNMKLPSFSILKVKKIDELSRAQSLKNISSNRTTLDFSLARSFDTNWSNGNPESSKIPEETGIAEGETVGELGTVDLQPLTAGASMITENHFRNLSNQAYSSGTASGKIQAQNLSQQGNDISTGMLAGSMAGSLVGSMFDGIVGPLGTIAGTAIGGALGSAFSSTDSRQINTTGGSVSAGSNNLPF
jgi:F0F1-type ATP synthase assembly protein I